MGSSYARWEERVVGRVNVLLRSLHQIIIMSTVWIRAMGDSFILLHMLHSHSCIISWLRLRAALSTVSMVASAQAVVFWRRRM